MHSHKQKPSDISIPTSTQLSPLEPTFVHPNEKRVRVFSRDAAEICTSSPRLDASTRIFSRDVNEISLTGQDVKPAVVVVVDSAGIDDPVCQNALSRGLQVIGVFSSNRVEAGGFFTVLRQVGPSAAATEETANTLNIMNLDVREVTHGHDGRGRLLALDLAAAVQVNPSGETHE
eukprot:CAMPEP_0185746392 /NCGR_PEP_ID=MMETSP1174-20130828/4941_1 /TAXON_ID=35687 /ORGANISM="Dictyocha speculum, Strain CCMP1381" /LENGTH=174 /DNA_ID=CAMNT_0028421043 /DNA_START=125 /DNA_END=649 /DNA_ORIENTATION=-